MSQIDWSKAPAEATHWDCRRPVSPAFMRKPEGATHWEWYGDGRWHMYGVLTSAEEAKLISRPESWPPVGIDVEIHNKSGRGIVKGAESFIGTTCKVLATFVNMNGFEMVSVEDSGGSCMCFRADMCGPVRTPEQIAAEEREKDCKEMLAIIKASPWGMTAGPHEVIALLYDASYRKFEITDE